MPMPKKVKAGAAAYRKFYDAARAQGATHKQAVAAWKKHKKAHKKAPKAAKKAAKRPAKRASKRTAKRGAGHSYEARVAAWRKSKPAAPPRGLGYIAHKKLITKKFHDWLRAYAWHLGFPRGEANTWAAMVIKEVREYLDDAAKHAMGLNNAKAQAAISRANEHSRKRMAAYISQHPAATPAKIEEVKKKIEAEAKASVSGSPATYHRRGRSAQPAASSGSPAGYHKRRSGGQF